MDLPRRHGTPLRVLVVDDDANLHGDYSRALATARPQQQLAAARDALFGGSSAPTGSEDAEFELVHAYDGASALALVERSIATGQRFSVAFVDMRMPPGWTGAETIRRLWSTDATIQAVLCTAFSDFTWDKVLLEVGRSEGLHLLRKPFVPVQVRRFAEVLSKKWQLAHSPTGRLPDGSP
jgi:CheY-like chemotaxis protein